MPSASEQKYMICIFLILQTALHLAVISNQVQMVDLLLKASASANVCDRKGNTVVHLAVRYKALPCLKKILQSSRIPLSLDARNYEGQCYGERKASDIWKRYIQQFRFVIYSILIDKLYILLLLVLLV